MIYIITAGDEYIDIDGLACCIAYQNLLTLKGLKSIVLLPGPLNETVPNSLRNILYKKSLNKDPNETYEYIIMDVSNPDFLSKIIENEKIVELYDHRSSYESYWKEKLGEKAKIEMVGACATLIWEEFVKTNLNIDEEGGILLYTAILSNTLNLKSQVTTDRDIKALEEIRKQIKIPENWEANYFNEVSEAILKNPREAMMNDTKKVTINGVDYKIIQIELWDNETFVKKNMKLIEELLNTENSFFTSPNISQGFNYIVAKNEELKEKLKRVVGAEFNGNLVKTNKLWLRKEIMRELGYTK